MPRQPIEPRIARAAGTVGIDREVDDVHGHRARHVLDDGALEEARRARGDRVTVPVQREAAGHAHRRAHRAVGEQRDGRTARRGRARRRRLEVVCGRPTGGVDHDVVEAALEAVVAIDALAAVQHDEPHRATSRQGSERVGAARQRLRDVRERRGAVEGGGVPCAERLTGRRHEVVPAVVERRVRPDAVRARVDVHVDVEVLGAHRRSASNHVLVREGPEVGSRPGVRRRQQELVGPGRTIDPELQAARSGRRLRRRERIRDLSGHAIGLDRPAA